MTCNPYPLFSYYPALASVFPVLPLANLPTPVQRLHAMEQTLSLAGLWSKCDDKSALPYGGNKVRKLAFLLGWAKAQNYNSILTYGAAGSNHALATALYSRQYGFTCHALLSPQENSPAVRKNLLGHLAAQTILHPISGRRDGSSVTRETMQQEYRQTGKYPFIIPPGGSSPLGILGYINAGMELAEQIKGGCLPQLDRIYVASGTMGTCVGLLIGLQCAGLHSVKVIAVRVTIAPYTSPEKARSLYHATCHMLHDSCSEFPRYEFPEKQFVLDDTHLGTGYGIPTAAAKAAVTMIQAKESIPLESTYTGKALAGLVAHTSMGLLQGKNVLFWNTYNSQSLDALINEKLYSALPVKLHTYFQT